MANQGAGRRGTQETGPGRLEVYIGIENMLSITTFNSPDHRSFILLLLQMNKTLLLAFSP